LVSEVVAELMAEDSPPAASKPTRKMVLTEAFERLARKVKELPAAGPQKELKAIIAEIANLLRLT
jgi:hypothetical protein